ncbi:ABC transporter substrate-binding protein [Marinomonas sp. SM2066]|uniref:ABC transporter substrate-binding protein n=2 Tax=Marinomonas colpomeniae TaxID=2774408 RepID=A0ABR8NZK7_9GAMM|nr:ABC transporter substrate-binding protein [Marinomonas colpomeniae]
MKKILSTVSLSALIGLSASQGAMAKETIVIGELNWDGAIAIEHVLKVILEDKFNVDVEFITADQAAIWSALDAGKGSIDVFPDIWTNLQGSAWKKFVLKGGKESVKANETPYFGSEGFYIPGYIQDEYGVNSVYDLAKPEIAKLFDADGDGVGEYWPGASGWELVKINQIKAKSYGFDKYFTPVVISDAILKAQLKKAYRKKEGILFYYWKPEWIHNAYDLRKLEEPEFTGYSNESKKEHKDYNPNGCYNYVDTDNWLAGSEINCAFPDSPVHIGYSVSLEQRAPEVAKFLSKVTLSDSMVSEWVFSMSSGDLEVSEMAEEWVEKNPEVVQSWLP